MKIRLEKTKAFWLYVVGGILCIVLGCMLMPVWESSNSDVFFENWGSLSVNIMISGLLLAYVLLYLVKRIRRYSGTPAQIVAIVELVLMVVIAVVCTVSAFIDSISFGDPCQIFGLVLWARGASGVFTGYYCDSEFVAEHERKNKAKKKNSEKNKKEEIDTDEEPRGRVDDFTVWRLSLAVILISLGTYMFIKPPFGALLLQWVFSLVIMAVGLFFTVYGIALKPRKVKVDAKKTAASDTNEHNNAKNTFGKDGLGGASENQALDGKVNIQIETSANAMTNTAALDAVSGKQSEENTLALIPSDDKKNSKN